MPKKNSQRIYSCDSYNIKHGDKFFFDANMWIAILNKNSTEEKYANKAQNFLKRIHDKGCFVYICPELISEVFNNLVRKEQRKSVTIGLNFKQFRKGKKCQEWIQDFSDQFSQLLHSGDVLFVNSEINSDDTIDYFQNKSKELDYKDFIYERICFKQGLILVTNDSDFAAIVGKVNKILSFNENLINKPF